jgi:hypothetical protein
MNTNLDPDTIAAIIARDIPCPTDMREEIARDPAEWVGGELWSFRTAAGAGHALRGPFNRAGEANGAMSHGADSVWGQWSDGRDGFEFQTFDRQGDDDRLFDAQGNDITSTGDAE